MTAYIGYSNAALDATFADVGSSFTTPPPLGNMGTMQVPNPSAEFSGATAEFSITFAASSTIRLLALISMDIDDSATITWKDSGGSTIASQTWSQFKTRPKNSFIVLSADENHSSVNCAISGAGSGTHRIGAAFTGKAWEFDQLAGFGWSPQSSAARTGLDGTDWVTPATRRRGIPLAAIGDRGQILGVDESGTEHSGDDAETVLDAIGLHGQIIAIPSTVNQTTIDALSIYGTLNSVGAPEHLEADIYRVRLNVLESR